MPTVVVTITTSTNTVWMTTTYEVAVQTASVQALVMGSFAVIIGVVWPKLSTGVLTLIGRVGLLLAGLNAEVSDASCVPVGGAVRAGGGVSPEPACPVALSALSDLAETGDKSLRKEEVAVKEPVVIVNAEFGPLSDKVGVLDRP